MSPPREARAPPQAEPPEPPPNGQPPLYYVEPQPPAQPPEPRPGRALDYEPPPPPPFFFYEPPPPPPLPRKAPPRTALWLGVRAELFVPFGTLWLDGFPGAYGIYYRGRNFSDYAPPGPAGEVDFGVRLARRYNLFAMWEHASLGGGSLESSGFAGGQLRGSTNLYGVGLRFSTDPTSVGFLMEVAAGYRQFSANWSDGTNLSLTGGWFDARIGMGADIRLSRTFSLSPMIVLGGGSFGQIDSSGPNAVNVGPAQPLSVTQPGEYGTLSFQLGGHADVF